MNEKIRATRNRTVTVSPDEQSSLLKQCSILTQPVLVAEVENKIFNQEILEAVGFLPEAFVDLLFIDPPYNLTKRFDDYSFKALSDAQYMKWFASWFIPVLRTLKANGSVYVCTDWRTSAIIYPLLVQHLNVRNRITWEREKGRGANHNWKNCSEDIWFCTKSDDYTFHADAVKVKRKVLAPYRHQGVPKDWQEEADGDFRLTAASNLWTDITVPFWSMPENTDHPTQKPEKLVAKAILASTNPGDFVFDPFMGSGTTPVVAKKLGRRYAAVEMNPIYCALAQKRLANAEQEVAIQGYENGVFYERNSQPAIKHKYNKDLSLF